MEIAGAAFPEVKEAPCVWSKNVNAAANTLWVVWIRGTHWHVALSLCSTNCL